MKNMENFVSKYTDINELGAIRDGYYLLLWLEDDNYPKLNKELCDAEVKRIRDLIERRLSLEFSSMEQQWMFIFTVLAVVLYFIVPPLSIICLISIGLIVFSHYYRETAFYLWEKDLKLLVKPDLLLELGEYYKEQEISWILKKEKKFDLVSNDVKAIIEKHNKSPLANLLKNDSSDSPKEENKEQFNSVPMSISQRTVSTQCNLFGDSTEIDKIPAGTGPETRQHGEGINNLNRRV